MGAPSIIVPEVVVNIGGSIASLNVDILFACMVEGENQLGGACRGLTSMPSLVDAVVRCCHASRHHLKFTI